MTRQKIDKLPAKAGQMTLGDAHHRHIIKVLRMKPGDIFTLFDGKGLEAKGEIISYDNKSLSVRMDAPKKVDRESKVFITLAFALSKGQKPEFVLQKGTEIGVKRFIIFSSKRSVTLVTNDNLALKMKRWETVIESACGQSGRTKTPIITYSSSTSKMLKEIEEELRLCFDPEADSLFSKKILPPLPKSVALLIGPEGGLTKSELLEATKNGFEKIKFSERILRAETAAICAVIPFGID